MEQKQPEKKKHGKRYVLVGGMLLLLLYVGCATPRPSPTPTLDTEATKVAMARAVEGTMTALAPTVTNTPSSTWTPTPTQTSSPTPMPTSTTTPTSAAAPEPTVTSTNTAIPTATPTNTRTLVPTATSTPTRIERPVPAPQSTAYSPPILLQPGKGWDMIHPGDIYGKTFKPSETNTVFHWEWDGQLRADEYFQVQIISRTERNKGEHRGIHPPTKGYSLEVGQYLWGSFSDWDGAQEHRPHPLFQGSEPRVYADWTVAIIKWDGKDPSKIGPTIIEAEPRYIKF